MADKPPAGAPRAPRKAADKSPRTRAREFALQALYQHLVGKNDPGEIDAFVPDRAASAERQMWNQEFIARILRIVQQENEAVTTGAEVASGDVGEELAREA